MVVNKSDRIRVSQ